LYNLFHGNWWFEIAFPNALFVDVLLWGVLFPAAVTINDQSTLLNFDSYMQHAANLLFITFDFIFLTQYSLTAWHVILFLLWLSFYGLYQVSWVTGGECYAYFFLDMSQPYTVIWLLVILVVGALFYFILASISWHCSCCLGKRYYVCDHEELGASKEARCLDCVCCQRCCKTCGPPRSEIAKEGMVDAPRSSNAGSADADHRLSIDEGPQMQTNKADASLPQKEDDLPIPPAEVTVI